MTLKHGEFLPLRFCHCVSNNCQFQLRENCGVAPIGAQSHVQLWAILRKIYNLADNVLFRWCASLNWVTPMQVLTGSAPDISPLIHFHWLEPAHCQESNNDHFPLQFNEKLGHFVGIAKNVGHTMTFKVLTNGRSSTIPSFVLL